jgi:hypothetical protein
MPQTAPTEWLLARIAGRDRAAAILGDLAEMAATRGQLWFWMAYARILVRLGWRSPVALVAGFAGFAFFMSFLTFWMLHTPPAWRNASRIFMVTGPLTAIMTVPLWFALPYGAVRYGFRDRFVRLACVLFLTSTTVLFYPPALSPYFASAAVLAVAASMILRAWRRPMIVLAATVAAGMTALVVSFNLLSKVYHPYVPDPGTFHLRGWIIIRLTVAFALWIAAMVCSRLHHWLLQRPAASDRTIA